MARLVDSPPEGDQWAHEFKFDGYRILAFVNHGKVVLKTRNDQDWTHRFPELALKLKTLNVKQAIFDGEVVALLPDGTSSFQELQQALSAGHTQALHYFVFDLLYLNGQDLRPLPLEDRKRQLKPLLPTGKKQILQFSRHWIGNGKLIFQKCAELGLEGMVSKRRDQPYLGGRGLDWLKTKLSQEEELLIVGYTSSPAARRGIGALLLGYYDAQGKLHYAGKVGTGFDDTENRQLAARFKPLALSKSPIEVSPPGQMIPRAPYWIRPKLVAQFKFSNWTRDGLLRQGVYLGLREDKPARSIVRDIPLSTELVENAVNKEKAAPKKTNLKS